VSGDEHLPVGQNTIYPGAGFLWLSAASAGRYQDGIFIVFICGLFSGAVSSSDCIASKQYDD
jgi:hypothetical protein